MTWLVCTYLVMSGFLTCSSSQHYVYLELGQVFFPFWSARPGARARLALASVPVSSTAISRCWVLAQMAPARQSRGTVAELIGQNPASARAQLLTSSATPVAWGSAYARFPAAACCLPAGHTTQWHKYFLIWSGYIEYSLDRAAGMDPQGRPWLHLNF